MKRQVLYVLIAVLLVGGVVALQIVRKNSTIRGLQVRIDCGGPYTLLSPKDIESLVVEQWPDVYSRRVKDIDKQKLEAIVQQSPYVRGAEVSISNGGKVEVVVKQRQPVVRMFCGGNEFYISHQGTYMPLAEQHYCHLLVGNCESEMHWGDYDLRQMNLAGSWPDTLAPNTTVEAVRQLWTLASFLYERPHYGDVFDQVCLDSSGDLVLVPKLGNLTVVVGDTSRLDEKFKDLWAFFDQGIGQVGWDTYSVISLKYNGQVVGRKRS